MANAPVVLLRANDISFLGHLRAAATVPGIDFVPVTFTWPGAAPWYSEHSRHFANACEIPNPVSDPQGALAGLVALGTRLKKQYGKKALAICSSDTNLVFIQEHEAVLAPLFEVMGRPDFSDFASDAAHKGTFFRLLTEALPGACPVTVGCVGDADVEAIANQVPYPVVVKPAVKDLSQSFYRRHGGLKVVECADADELRTALPPLLAEGYDLVVQEKIPFDGAADEIPAYCYVDRQGELRVFAAGIKQVIWPEKYGTAIALRLSLAEEVRQDCIAVAEMLGWCGTLMVEFVRDNRDGSLKILEINTRPWLFHDFYRQAGLPFVPHSVHDWLGTLPPHDGVIVPDEVAQQTSNFDLWRMAEHALGPAESCTDSVDVATTRLIDHLAGYAKHLRFARYEPSDPGPMRALLADLTALYPLDGARLMAWIEDRAATR